jgi:guanylate kinase
MSSESPEPRVDRGTLIVVSAPSGAGKTSLAARALKRAVNLRFSVSYTTRPPRRGEQNGVDYFFVTKDEFSSMRQKGEFLEWAEVHGHLYATQRAQVEQNLAQGLDVILDIDVQGAAQVRHQMPDSISIFILPPSREVLESRLRIRNENEPADLERRMLSAAREVSTYDQFDYAIINDDLDRALGSLEAIIEAVRRRPRRQESAIRAIISTFEGDS